MSSSLNSNNSVIVDTSHSPYAQLHPLSLTQVSINDAFWTPRLEANRRVTLPSQYQQCEDTGRLNNFRRVTGAYEGEYQGPYYNDSDVYKWIEAASWTLATHPDAELEAQVNDTIALIAAAQDTNGYLDTYFTFERTAERWTNLRALHELYCAGHLIQAAVAHARATQSDTLLNVAIRFANHILDTFGPNARSGSSGHPEIEMALVELSRITGDTRYLQEAKFFIDQRGTPSSTLSGWDYLQDHAPVREQHEIVGHAVRALYLYSGVTDVYTEMGEKALLDAAEAVWYNFMERRVYITGGAGARHEGESFGDDYELPNERAYAETCASIASMMWNWRLLQLNGEARFADAIENVLYNGLLSGLSLDGTHYFYENPLADSGNHRRQPWFGTACCPPNLARLLAELPGYVYSTSDEGMWVHLYIEGSATTELPNAPHQNITLQQKTNYPWSGDIELTLQLDEPATFSLFLRIPAWANGAHIKINGESIEQTAKTETYIELHRFWQSGDTVQLSLPMTVRLMESHPHITNNSGRVAIMRGPLVYCIEQVDQPGFDLFRIMLPVTSQWEEVERPDLLGGIIALRTEALYSEHVSSQQPLYHTYEATKPAYRPISLTAIPYYTWANREAGAMCVWLPVGHNDAS
ncbi:MAG TPA: glycoside hydrolase family 127 protein [Ktedonobacter sp.]|nr:glycoside hydrolase family 127 protein [Ktedonobacter sp.]